LGELACVVSEDGAEGVNDEFGSAKGALHAEVDAVPLFVPRKTTASSRV
jgi:hypothetical protein